MPSIRIPAALAAVVAACAIAPAAAHATTGASYVALGDSYSSGEGLPPYLSGSATLTNHCHRSDKAYGARLASQHGGSFAFVACSGAATNDLFAPNYKNPEPAQFDALGTATQTVTVTIGGNDLGFTNWVGACLTYAPTFFGMPGPSIGEPGEWGCHTDPLLVNQTNVVMAALAGTGSAVLRTLEPESPGALLGTPRTDDDGQQIPVHSIESVLREIHDRAPNARIFLVGYPSPFGSDQAKYKANPFNTVSGYQCGVTPPTALTYDYLDAQASNAVQDAYAQIQQAAVAELAGEGVDVRYVDPTTFDGHANCDTYTVNSSGNPVTSQKWINGISPTVTGSFHPSDDGQRLGYKPAVLAAGF